MKINWTIIVSLVAVVLIGATGFVAYDTGYKAGNQSAVSVQREFFQNRVGQQGQGGQGNPNAQGNSPAGQNAQGGRANIGRPVAAGTVKSVQGNTIVVTEQNGTAVTVMVDAQTQIIKSVTAQISDIQTGARVIVTSDQASTSGTPVNARLITIQGAGVPQTP